MKTKSGAFTIFDITEFLPGRPIPEDYENEAQNNGPFFFLPSHWSEESYWGGSWMIYIGHRKYPEIYSTGFQTAEEALAAAEGWEATQAERDKRDAANHQSLWG